jgi:hypothetical protein
VGVAVGVTVGVGVFVGIAVGVAVGVTVGVAVFVGAGVGVAVGISVGPGATVGAQDARKRHRIMQSARFISSSLNVNYGDFGLFLTVHQPSKSQVSLNGYLFHSQVPETHPPLLLVLMIHFIVSSSGT